MQSTAQATKTHMPVLSIPSESQKGLFSFEGSSLLVKNQDKFSSEQICSPSSTNYNEEGSDYSDTASNLTVSRTTSDAVSPVIKSEFIQEMSVEGTTSRKTSAGDSEEEVEADEDEIKDWSEKKEKLLKNLATKCKYDWKKIAKKFNTTEKSDIAPAILKQKYKGMVNASIPLRVKFSHEEDLMIAKYFDMYGCDWLQIATHFTDRNAMMLKNRYYSHIRKRNLLGTMLTEVKGDPIEEKQEEKVEEEVEEEAQNEEIVAEKPAEEKVEVKVESTEHNENHNRAYSQAGHPYMNIVRFSLNQIFDMESALSCELHHKITYYY